MRPLALLSFATLFLLFGGCTSDDAGSTLEASLEDVVVVLGAESPSTDSSKPTLYEATGSVVALVRYQGERDLAYQWSVFPPGEVSVVGNPTDEELELECQVLALPGSDPNIGSGVGSIRLTVYEKNGSLLRTVTSKLYVITSDGG
jgi:hypothetical protein